MIRLPRRLLGKAVPAYLALCALPLALIIWYVAQERYIYFWDLSGYHGMYLALGSLLKTSPETALAVVASSIRQSDYNYSSVLLLMPAGALFRGDRLGFVLAITVTFAYPAIACFGWHMSNILATSPAASIRGDVGAWTIAMSVIALHPRFWGPVLLGYVDVVGLVVVFLAFAIYLRYQPLSERPRAVSVLLGLLLVAAVLLRRWYAYWVVGFLTAITIDALIPTSKELPWFSPPLRRRLAAIALVAAVALVVLFAAATPIALRMVVTDYADLNSAWRWSPSRWQSLLIICSQFGWLSIAAAAGGLVLVLAVSSFRRVGLVLAVQSGVTGLLFWRTQDFGSHHLYLLGVPIWTFSALLACHLYQRRRSQWAKMLVVLVVVGVGTANLLTAFHPRLRQAIGPVAFIASSAQPPLVRNDLDEVRRLLGVLRTLPPSSRVYVLSSSFQMNDEILSNAWQVLGREFQDLSHRVVRSAHVDKRDGFPSGLLTADYVVLTEPIGYHLAPRDQRVIGIPAQLLIEGQGVGKAFTRLPAEFALDSGTTVYLYRRTSSVDDVDVRDLSEMFIKEYPERRTLFEVRKGEGPRALPR